MSVKFQFLLLMILVNCLGLGCGGGFSAMTLSSTKEASEVPSAALNLDGVQLYAKNCASCHGVLASSSKSGRTAAQITSAIGTMPTMSSLQTLSAAQISAIATALAPPPTKCEVTDPGRMTIRRLNREEYNNTLRDLLSISIRPADKFPADAFGETFNNNADALTLNSTLLDLYIAAAQTAVDEAFRLNRNKFMVCAETTDSCAKQILTPFLERAFRRAVAPAEVTRLVNFVTVAKGQSESFERGIKLAMQAVLVSPDFLYFSIRHTAPDDPARVIELNEFELATRLSYFIWSSMPDDQLLAAAKNKTLKSSLSSQVTRMLADPKSQALIDNFAAQWLSLHNIKNVQPNMTLFPQFNEDLRADMLTETKLLLKEIFSRNLSPHELLKANYTFVNNRLAAHYGIAGVTSPAFQKVSTTDIGRQGLLGHASISLLTSHSDYPSIIFRGKFVINNLLCDPPPAPPPVIPPLPGNSEIEKSASRLTDPRCMSCHTRMDPIGYALQGFNTLGQLRTFDETGVLIDGRGTMPTGETFVGPIELSKTILNDSRLNACVSKKLMSYALARDLTSADSCSIRQAAQFVGADKPISQIIQAIVESEPFRKQRGDGGVR